MKSKINILFVLAIIVITAVQCKKKKTEDAPVIIEEPTTTPPATTFTAISQVFSSLGSPNQTYTVNAATGTTLNVNGVVIELPTDAFLTSTSSTVTGVVDVTVKTILTKSQIMFSGAGANSTNSRLVSTKGCVKVTASQNTQSLRLGTSGTVFVNVSDAAGTIPMKKYYASKVTAVDSTIVWDLGTDVNDIPLTLIGSVNHHKASLDSLKWLNVGTMWDSLTTNKSAVIVNTDTIFNKTNCVIYLSLNGSLTVGALFQLAPGKFRISNIPNGRGVHIVGLAVKNGQYYSAVMSTVTGAVGYNLNMQIKSLSQIQSDFAAIP